jgi:hypothetical protein
MIHNPQLTSKQGAMAVAKRFARYSDSFRVSLFYLHVVIFTCFIS